MSWRSGEPEAGTGDAGHRGGTVDRLEKHTGEAILSQNTSPVKHTHRVRSGFLRGRGGNTGMALANGVDHVYRHVVMLLESLTLFAV
jgi:hypothetical protein